MDFSIKRSRQHSSYKKFAFQCFELFKPDIEAILLSVRELPLV